MANELSLNVSLTFNKSGAQIVSNPGGKSVTVSGATGIKNVISVGTTDETIDLGDVGTIGYCLLRNLDGTNYVSIGSDGTLYPLKLKAGEYALARWNAAAIHMKANTAACAVEYTIIPD